MPVTDVKSSICIYVSDLSWSIAECLKEIVTPPGQCKFLAVYRQCPAKSLCLPVTRTVELAYSCTIQLYLCVIVLFLGSFTKLHKVTTIFVTSVRPHGTTRFPLGIFFWNSKLGILQKSVEKIKDSLISDKNNGYFTWNHMHIYDNISLSSS